MTDMQKIEAGYRSYKDIYDDALTSQGFWMKLYNRIVWGIEDKDYVGKVLSYIPDGFSGSLLDVPVGTGVHTFRKYTQLKDARITVLDYSADMLAKAKRRMAHSKNVSFMQGDVGSLPFESASFDMVFSMNGFHAFPDKQSAFEETFRVLKAGGVFCGCFYIKGQRRLTDIAVRRLYTTKGWFTPPFFTLEEVQGLLEKRYRKVRLEHVKSIACFCCVK